MLTHANLYANAEQCVRWFAHAPAGPRRILGVLPLFHVFAMTVIMNWALFEGAEMILMPRFKLDGSAAHHRAQEADGHGRRADLVQRHAERARSRDVTI